MKCSVINCKNTHRGKTKPLGFYTFPRDKDLYTKWVAFCRRTEVSKSARVCGEHFRPEDFDRSIKYELGFTKFNVLKRGAIPTVYNKDVSPATEVRQKYENLRIQKEMVANMLKETDCTAKLEPFDTNSSLTLPACYIKEEICEPHIASEPVLPTPNLLRKYERPIIDELEQKKLYESHIEQLEQKVNELKRKNFKLTLAAEDREKQISLLQRRIDSMESDSRILNEQLLNIFTPGQLRKLKSGKRKVSEWSLADIEHANAIYKESKTAYQMLKDMNFPIPSVRTLQRVAHPKMVKTGESKSNQSDINT